MTGDNTAAILGELRRIGAEVDALSAPLVGTGLRASDVLDWLREIPRSAGLVDLTRRLDECRSRALEGHVPNADWVIEGPHPRLRPPRKRDWPTQRLLDAGTELMIEEWDPFGFRHAGRERETIAMFVFHFFGPLLAPNGLVDAITHTTEMIASAERDRLGLTPSPEPHRRYLAIRLRELVDRYPVPPVREWPPSAAIFVVVGDDVGPPPLDPEGVCVRCHSFGTVARMTVMSSPPTLTRYCRRCWNEVRSEHMPDRRSRPATASEQIARLDRMGRPPMSWESRSWDDMLENLEQLRASRAEVSLTSAEELGHLARFAAHLWAMDEKMDGPMPPEVEAFARQYAPQP